MNTLSALIIKVYRLFYMITRLKLPAYIIALAYVTVLHLILILGLAVLLEDLVPSTIIIVNMFLSKKIYFIAAALFGINLAVCPSFKSIITDMSPGSSYTLLVMYTFIDVVLLGFEYLMLR